MGLDTSHNCWHGAYSAFARWRRVIAEAAGYSCGERGVADLDWGCIERTIGSDLLGQWPSIPMRPNGTEDPLIVLLAHSDCEGEIQAEFCAPLADALEALVPRLPDEDGWGHIGNYRDKTRQFVAGLRLAASAGQSVEFH